MLNNLLASINEAANVKTHFLGALALGIRFVKGVYRGWSYERVINGC